VASSPNTSSAACGSATCCACAAHGQLLSARRLAEAGAAGRRRHRLRADQGDRRARPGAAQHATDGHLLGCAPAADLYLLQLAQQWAAQHRWIRFVPVLSESPPADGWHGRTGLVHAAAMHDHPDLSQHQAYVCGAPAMVAAARRDFLAHCRLPADEFFADSFDYAPDTQQAIATGTLPEMKVPPHD
jgi:hypothetical protein